MQIWSLEKEDTPHSFSSRVFLQYYKFFLKKFYSLFGFFIFVNFFSFKIILLYFSFLVSFVFILFFIVFAFLLCFVYVCFMFLFFLFLFCLFSLFIYLFIYFVSSGYEGHDEIPCFFKLGSCFNLFFKFFSFLFFIPDNETDDNGWQDGWMERTTGHHCKRTKPRILYK